MSSLPGYLRQIEWKKCIRILKDNSFPDASLLVYIFDSSGHFIHIAYGFLRYVAVASIDIFVDFLAVVVHAGFVVAGGKFAPEGVTDEDVDDCAGFLLVGPVVHLGDLLCYYRFLDRYRSPVS